MCDRSSFKKSNAEFQFLTQLIMERVFAKSDELRNCILWIGSVCYYAFKLKKYSKNMVLIMTIIMIKSYDLGCSRERNK